MQQMPPLTKKETPTAEDIRHAMHVMNPSRELTMHRASIVLSCKSCLKRQKRPPAKRKRPSESLFDDAHKKPCPQKKTWKEAKSSYNRNASQPTPRRCKSIAANEDEYGG